MNHVTLIGRLGRDPEIRSTAGGTAVANFSLATTERWKDAEGERQEETTWHQVVVWRGLVNAARLLATGDLVALAGRIQNRSYEKEGETVYVSEIVAGSLEFLKVKAFAKEAGVAEEPSEVEESEEAPEIGEIEEAEDADLEAA